MRMRHIRTLIAMALGEPLYSWTIISVQPSNTNSGLTISLLLDYMKYS